MKFRRAVPIFKAGKGATNIEQATG